METELSDGGSIERALGGYIGSDGGNNDGLYDCIILGRIGRHVFFYLPVEQQRS